MATLDHFNRDNKSLSIRDRKEYFFLANKQVADTT
jgi:hypothetical protein